MTLLIRPARETDATVLSALALSSKAYWPYDEQFIRDCVDDLTISPERAGDGFLFVGELQGTVIGFFGFAADHAHPEMTHLFVEPARIGHGIGRQLWNHAIAFARDKKWTSFEILADPYAAENFYLPMGCRKIGEVESSLRPGRMLPLLRFDCR